MNDQNDPSAAPATPSQENECSLLTPPLSEQIRLLNTILTASRLLIFVQHPDGRFIYANDEAVAALGRDCEEILGKTPRELGIPPETAAAWEEHCAQVLHTGHALTGEALLPLSESIEHDYEYTLVPLQEPDGRVAAVATTARDLTERRRAERALRESEERLQLVLRALDEGIWDWDLPSGLLFLSERCQELLGVTVSDFQAELSDWAARVHPEDRADLQRAIDAHLEGRTPFLSAEYRVLLPDGESRWVRGRAQAVRDAEGKPIRLTGSLTDVSERIQAAKAIDAAEARYRRLVDSNILGVATTHRLGHFSEANDAFLRITGFSREDLEAGQVRWDHPPPEWRAAFQKAVGELHRTGVASPREVEFVRKDGSRVPILGGAAQLDAGDGNIGIGFLLDLSAQKAAQQQIGEQRDAIQRYSQELERANAQLEMLAAQDSLTGLNNLRALTEWLADAWAYAVRYQSPLSLLMADVDWFKSYNDAFGHPAGDVVLRRVAGIVAHHARRTDFVARYGGEEFIVVLPHTDSDGALVIAERIRVAIAEFEWDRRPVTLSVGVAALMPNAIGVGRLTDSADLIARADQALYRSKAAGRNQVTAA